MKPFVPVRFMLADVMYGPEEIINYYNKPLIYEYKYDGIRLQLHRFNKEALLFSRNLVDITYVFPELVKAAIETTIKTTNTMLSNQVDFIVDGELVAFKNGKPLHHIGTNKNCLAVNKMLQLQIDILYNGFYERKKKGLESLKHVLDAKIDRL